MAKRRASRSVTKKKTGPVEVFVSYSHVNSAWFKRLDPVLKFTRPAKIAHVWHDQKLKAGERWDDEIRDALERMDVFVCLVSYEFLASDYIMDVELKRALARARKREVEIVAIVLYDSDLKKECPRLSKFQLPLKGGCWRDYEKDGGYYQDAHKPIREAIRRARENGSP